MLDDDNKLYSKFSNKRVNAFQEGIPFRLTYKQYRKLVRRARLKSSDLGFSGRGYVLARYNDTGPYEMGNCRFITQLENAREKKISDKSRKASSKNAKRAHDVWMSIPPEERSRRVKEGLSENTKKRRAVAKKKRIEFEKTAHKSYLGERNSQYGSFWITNGSENRKWHPDKGKIPKKFYRGRTT